MRRPHRPRGRPSVRTACSPADRCAGDHAIARAVFASLDGLVLQYVGGAIDRVQFDDSVSALWRMASAARPASIS